MLVLVKANVLGLGLGGKGDALKALPIRVLNIETGRQAGSSLKNECVDSVISKWNLPDSPDGRFLRSLRLAKPYMPIIVLVDAGDVRQEIAARGIGAAAVLNSDVSDAIFKKTVACVLGIDDARMIEEICAIADDEVKR